MKIYWENASGDGSIYAIDIFSRGMFYLSDSPKPKKCQTCGQLYCPTCGKPHKNRLRWLSHDVGCKPTRFYPRWLSLPDKLEKFDGKSSKSENRIRDFLKRSVKLLKHKHGMLFIWWRINGEYLDLSPYWVPIIHPHIDFKYSVSPIGKNKLTRIVL